MKTYIILDHELISRVFWTGTTKSTCEGQFSDCFDRNDDHGDSEFLLYKNILASFNGGACVGFVILDKLVIPKALPCESKAFLACQGDSVKSATNFIGNAYVSNFEATRNLFLKCKIFQLTTKFTFFILNSCKLLRS